MLSHYISPPLHSLPETYFSFRTSTDTRTKLREKVERGTRRRAGVRTLLSTAKWPGVNHLLRCASEAHTRVYHAPPISRGIKNTLAKSRKLRERTEDRQWDGKRGKWGGAKWDRGDVQGVQSGWWKGQKKHSKSARQVHWKSLPTSNYLGNKL